MVVAVTAAVVGLVAVWIALYRDDPLAEPGPALPDWDPLPTPADVARVEFPLAFPGYDPATVDITIAALSAAYADLLAAAPPQVVERARHRAELRVWRPDERRDTRRDRAAVDDATNGADELPDAPPEDEALRVAAALAALEAEHRRATRPASGR